MQKTNSKEYFKKYHSGKCTSEEKAILEHYNLEVNLSLDYIEDILAGLTYKSSDSEQPGPKLTDHNHYNTLRTPPAGQVKIILTDGSKVRLNAASSLKYPLTFHGRDREDKYPPRFIELSGEAYFETAKNKQLAKKQSGGLLSRSGKISDIFYALIATTDVHFNVEGRNVTVM